MALMAAPNAAPVAPYLQAANSRDGRVLIVDNYRFVRNKVFPNKIHWCCTRCNVRMQTRWIVVLAPPRDHAHPPDDDLIASTAIIEQMLDQVVRSYRFLDLVILDD